MLKMTAMYRYDLYMKFNIDELIPQNLSGKVQFRVTKNEEKRFSSLKKRLAKVSPHGRISHFARKYVIQMMDDLEIIVKEAEEQGQKNAVSSGFDLPRGAA